MAQIYRRARSLAFLSTAVLLAASARCGGVEERGQAGPYDASTSDSHPLAGDAPTSNAPCDPSDGGWSSCVDRCEGGTSALLTGKVYDPAGRNPVDRAVVYVPNDPQGRIPAITPGTNMCNPCAINPTIPYDAVAASSTDESGTFTLAGVPTGENVPLVFQIGKWRREVTVTTHSCATTAVPAELSRLPRNQAEGDIPQMALLTGACDRLGCFLRSVGLDASEFTGPDGGGRVHVYRGAGPGPNLSGGGGGIAGDCSGASGPCPLWSTKQQLERYDKVFLGCECSENNQTKPDMTPIHDWLEEGGWVFAFHVEDTWFKNGPPDFQAVANWVNGPAAGATGPFVVDTSLPKGISFERWLTGVGAVNPDGTLPFRPSDVSTSVSSVSSQAYRWVYDSSQSPEAVKLLSFYAPIGGIAQVDGGSLNDSGSQPPLRYCGKAVFSDIHVGSDGSASSAPVPASCSGAALAPEDEALEFWLFDETMCLSSFRPPPPPPPPRDD
jgi:hypothetical protein